MNASSDEIKAPLLEIFLSDLFKDVTEIKVLLESPQLDHWMMIKKYLIHIAGCARLVSYQPMEVAVQALQKIVDEIMSNLAGSQKLIDDFSNEIELLFQVAQRTLSLDNWKASSSIFDKNPLFSPATNKELTAPKPMVAEESLEPILVLFANELEMQTAELTKSLLRLENKRDDKLALQIVMRAAHSVKGAARVVNLSEIVRLAHLMEECFVNIQKQALELDEKQFELLFKCIDFLSEISKQPAHEILNFVYAHQKEVEQLCREVEGSLLEKNCPLPSIASVSDSPKQLQKLISVLPLTSSGVPTRQRALRINAETLNRLMGLAGEALVESRWMTSFSNALVKLKREYDVLMSQVDQLRISLENKDKVVSFNEELTIVQHKINLCQQEFSGRLAEFEMFSQRYSNIAERLYHEFIESRMRPFSDIIGGFPRMIRDLAKELHKKVRLEMHGESTPVDREILEKLEIPLTHLLRNALDHGIESPQERLTKNKPEEGYLLLTAQHRAGMLEIHVSDDGAGINVELIKQMILDKQLASAEMLQNLSQQELFAFMLLPGFSTAKKVTEISGRGVGLSAVQNFVQEVGGHIHLESKEGEGFHLMMTLPLTLSVIRALLAQIAGEPYAVPLAKINQVFFVEKELIEYLEQRPFFHLSGANIGLISASEILELETQEWQRDPLSVIILSEQDQSYGIIVDRFIGEKELVVQELDPLLGKIPNISAGAFMEDGSPILILDTEDLLRSIEVSISGGRLRTLRSLDPSLELKKKKKRILVVDDSITVREVESHLLESQGYDVETAINGMDGWNALRTASYDLVVTDIDMPRMNGIELLRNLRADSRFAQLPVIIVSYKENEEDKKKGLDAGANYYLTKSSFQDETLVNAVRELLAKTDSTPTKDYND